MNNTTLNPHIDREIKRLEDLYRANERSQQVLLDRIDDLKRQRGSIVDEALKVMR